MFHQGIQPHHHVGFFKRFTLLCVVLSVFSGFSSQAASLKDFSVSMATLDENYPDIVDLMSGDSQAAFVRFLGYLKRMGGSQEDQQEFLALLLKRLKRQSETDLPWYTSHNAGHSLRVLQKMQKIMKEHPDYMNWAYRRYSLLDHPHKQDIVLFLGSFIALVHDTGYSDFTNVLKTPKYVHAQLGADVIESSFSDLLKRLLPVAPDIADRLVMAVYYAVLYHNADDLRYVNGALQKRFNHLFYGTWRRDFYGAAKTYYRAVISKEPFLLLVRFADNLDFSRDRLFAHQKSELYLRLLNSITSLDAPNGARGSKEWVNALRSHYLDQLENPPIYHEYADDEQYRLLKDELESGTTPTFPQGKLSVFTTSLLAALPGDFPHIYSNYVVQDVGYKKEDGRGVVSVEFAQNVMSATQLDKHYQLKRMAESLYSCEVRASRLVDLLFVRSSSAIDETGIPLSSFTWMERTGGGLFTRDPFLTERLIGLER